jgi:hypothetical protein
VRILLDEMWPATIASQLRERDHDAVAVAERADLRGQPDEVLFAAAQLEGRVVVTENVVDFRPIATAWILRGERHSGVVFTSNRRFPRHDQQTLGRLVSCLDELCREQLNLSDQEYWLS